jgi:hypothetical protein
MSRLRRARKPSIPPQDTRHKGRAPQPLSLLAVFACLLAVAGCRESRPDSRDAAPTPINLPIHSVTVVTNSIGGRTYDIAYDLPSALVKHDLRLSDASPYKYAIFTPDTTPNAHGLWRFRELSAAPAYQPTSRLALIADWSFRYGWFMLGETTNAATSAERDKVLISYACRDLAARVDVFPSGVISLKEFRPLRTAHMLTPCLTR